ncbi:MAG TPA: FGGY family carbohydrate kinase [Candidatus Limnocylindrales bacterium]|nr:FGGY family carbohydrate kinase [Candidatus Limnocylindrales bacterium]
MADLLVGIDVGTQSSKGVLVRPDGSVVAEAREPHPMFDVRNPGWAEQDADAVWWADVCSIARRLAAAVPTGDRIAGVGVSAIGPCVLPLDETGRPLRPAILYGVDTRATEQIAALEARYGAAELERWSGMELGSQASGPKIAWLADHEPEIHARARWFVTSTTYLVHRLTGSMVIDARTASHFNPLFDRSTIGWSDRYAGGITSIDRLASIAWPADLAGTITAEAAEATGLPAGVPVAVGTLDALSEAISVGVSRPGDLMIMYGSTTFFITVTAEPVEAGKLWLTAGSERGTWALSAGLATGGSALRWFRDELAPDLVAAEAAGGVPAFAALSQEAAAATDVGGREDLAFLPYFAGERTPINDPLARGVVTGLSLASGRGDLYLALLQGIAYATRSNIEAMEALGAPIRRIVAVGGGTADLLLLQLVSDACGIEQSIPASTIGAARGDAILAGLASGVLAREDIDGWMSVDRVVRPRPEERAGHDRRYAAFRALYESTRDIVHGLG